MAQTVKADLDAEATSETAEALADRIWLHRRGADRIGTPPAPTAGQDVSLGQDLDPALRRRLHTLEVSSEDGQGEGIERDPPVLMRFGRTHDDGPVVESVLDRPLDVQRTPSPPSTSLQRSPQSSSRRQPVTAARAMVQARIGWL